MLHVLRAVHNIVLLATVLILVQVSSQYSAGRLTSRNYAPLSTVAISRHIFGGTGALRGDFPWQVSINITKAEGNFFCGGALIHESWVLTAAHCLKNGTDFLVRSGSTNISSGGHRYRTKTAHLHPRYDVKTQDNDIALLRLPRPASISNKVYAIDLVPFDVVTQTELYVSGWGKTGPNKGCSAQLMFATLRVVRNSKCASSGSRPGRLCALGVDKASPCLGDSGSPLVLAGAPPYLVGVVSLAASKCQRGVPSVFTRVKYFTSWITKIIHD